MGGAFGLNLAWEWAHWPLYRCGPSRRRAAICARMAAGDAALVASAVHATAAATRRTPRAFTPALLAALAVAAVVGELDAQRRGRWAYRPAMPRLGPLGLSPLVQLPATGWMAHALARKHGEGGHH